MVRRDRRFARIADDIRKQVTKGYLTPGSRLPTKAELSERYEVSPETVQRAINTLRATGVITARAGIGWYVAEPPPRITRYASARLSRSERAAGRAGFQSDLREAEPRWEPAVDVTVSHTLPSSEIAALLGTGTVLVRDRVMRTGQVVTQLATSWLPAEITSGTAIEKDDTGPGGTYARLEELGWTLSRFTESVVCRDPTEAEAEHLSLTDGRAVVETERHAHSGDRIVEVIRTVIPADRVRLVYTWPAE